MKKLVGRLFVDVIATTITLVVLVAYATKGIR